jgi:hypothetical protein
MENCDAQLHTPTDAVIPAKAGIHFDFLCAEQDQNGFRVPPAAAPE